jgi:hypothetical protein
LFRENEKAAAVFPRRLLCQERNGAQLGRVTLFFLPALFLDRGLGGSQAGDGDAEGRAAHVAQARAAEELHTVQIAALFAADAGTAAMAPDEYRAPPCMRPLSP